MGERATEKFGIVGAIDPVKYTTDGATGTTDVIDASLYDKVVFLFQVGNISSSSGKLVFTIYEGTATATVSTSLDTLTWTASSTGDQNLQWLMEVESEALAANYRYLKGKAVYTGGTGASISCAVLGFNPRFHPGTKGDLASVQTIIYST